VYYEELFKHYYYSIDIYIIICSLTTEHVIAIPSLRITVLVETSTTSLRQGTTSLLHNRTSETNRPLRISILSNDSIAISNDTSSLLLGSLDNDSIDVGCISVIVVGKVDHSNGVRGVAAKEDGVFVEAFGEEGGEVRDEGHTSKSLSLSCFVGADDGGAGGEVVGGVCAIVGGDDDVDVAFGLDQGPEGHGRVAFTAIYNLDLLLCVGEGGGRVLVEGVGVRGVEIAGNGAVSVEDNSLQSLDQRLGVVLCRDSAAVVVEESGTGACYVAKIVVILDAFSGYIRLAVGQFGPEVGGLSEGIDVRVPRSEFERSLLNERLFKMILQIVGRYARIHIVFRFP
jgi:hypothetical protein